MREAQSNSYCFLNFLVDEGEVAREILFYTKMTRKAILTKDKGKGQGGPGGGEGRLLFCKSKDFYKAIRRESFVFARGFIIE